MFYYPTVLKRHSGCFSTIWLVATKAVRVPRREFLKVNVKSTCDDIMNYLLEQVPPPRPDLPRPRFSLYLSSQLQYGVIVVFHRQCAILLEEVQSIMERLLKQRTSQIIDIDNSSRRGQDCPDALSLLEETEGAPDPLFGVIYTQHLMPSPTTLMQMGKDQLRERSPESPELSSPAAAEEREPEREREQELQSITASPDSITLRETEPVTIAPAEFEGMDLVHQHPDTIDLLLAETDHFPEDVPIPGEEQEGEMERKAREEDLEEEGPKELTGSTVHSQPASLPSDDGVLLPQEESGLALEKPVPPTDEVTPIPAPVLPSPPPAAQEQESPSLELEEMPPPPPPPPPPPLPVVRRRRRRRRQLIFFDPETQLTEEMLQRQIGDVLFETRPVPLLLPSAHRSAADLLSNPCTCPLPEEVLFLWRQAVTITPVSGSDLQVGERGPESTDSEKERERKMVAEAEAAEREEERQEGSTTEVPRDVAESEMFDISGMGTLPLEASEQREASRDMSPMFSSDREGSVVSRSLSIPQGIPEVVDELLARPPGLSLEAAEDEGAAALFRSLLPPDVDRRTVSTIFKKLLEALSSQKVTAVQTEPYGDILISPGPEYKEVRLDL